VTDLKAPEEVQPKEAPAPLRTVRPVLIWATIGALCVVFAAYIFTAWIVSGDATPADPGPDPVPTLTRIATLAFQIITPILALSVITYVVRKSLRERRLCTEAMVVIGSAIAWWHDPLINWFQPALFYNATLVNFGAWVENIPGWLSPDGRLMAEPMLMIGLSYVWMPLTLGSVGRWAMGRARRRWPALGPVRTFCCGWLAVYLIEFPLEIIAVHTGLVAYPATPPALTLWAGEIYQMPIYGPMLWSLVLTASGGLLFFRDAPGRTAVERGIDSMKLGARTKQVISLLAITGFLHVVAIGVYDIPVNFAGLYAGPTKVYPTYLRTQLCGPDTPRPCPDGTRFDDPSR
jgi:hypothetical protein